MNSQKLTKANTGAKSFAGYLLDAMIFPNSTLGDDNVCFSHSHFELKSPFWSICCSGWVWINDKKGSSVQNDCSWSIHHRPPACFLEISWHPNNPQMTSRQYSSSSASASSLRQSETACVSAIKAAAKASENGGITSSNQLYCCSHSRGADRPICTAPDLPARLGERRKLICIKFGCPRASYIHPAVACSVLREFRCVQSRGCVNGGKRNPSAGGGPRVRAKQLWTWATDTLLLIMIMKDVFLANYIVFASGYTVFIWNRISGTYLLFVM